VYTQFRGKCLLVIRNELQMKMQFCRFWWMSFRLSTPPADQHLCSGFDDSFDEGVCAREGKARGSCQAPLLTR
jgi:hypothetical protein